MPHPTQKSEYDATLTYQKISLNLQKSASFSGPGMVQKLLTEFNFYEIKTRSAFSYMKHRIS